MLSVKEDILKNVGKQTVVGKHSLPQYGKQVCFYAFMMDGHTFLGFDPHSLIIKHGSQDIYIFL